MRYPLGPHPTNASTSDPAEPTHAADTSVKTPNHTPLDTKVVDDPAAEDLIVTTTTTGTIRGLRLTIPGPLRTWRGVPYGDTTAGNHRFRAPHPAPRWDGIKDCTEYGAIAAQPSLTPSDRIRGSEDCLNLDIVRPDDAPSPSSSTSTAAPSSTDPATNKSSAATTSSKPWTWSMSP